MYRSPSPYGAPPESHYSSTPQSPGGGPQITPGSITYTTSIGPEGRVVYHPFKAVPASYQTPTGIVSGIQWVPAEATQILPAGAQPASTEFAQAWSRGNLSKEDQKALKEWQRSEEKRRKREEKDSMKMLREKDRYNQSRYDNDPDLRIARERDASAANLQRRKSFNQGYPPPSAPVSFPTTGAPGGYPPGFATSDRSGYGAPGPYPPSPNAASPGLGYPRERKYSMGGTLSEQFGDLNLDHDDRLPNAGLARPRKYSTHEAVAERARRMSGNFGTERPSSMYDNAPGAYPVPTTGSTAGFRAGVPYSNPSPALRSVEPPYMQAAPRPSSPYATANYPPPMSASQDPYGARAASPYHRAASPFGRSASPYAAGGGDVYPPGHIMEGRPISSARSRATTPIPGMPASVAFPSNAGPYSQAGMPGSMPGGMSPNMTPMMPGALPSGTLAAPECFSRPINAAHPYTPFEPMRIQDMDLFLESLPRMPIVLQTHDVYSADWARLVDDVRLAWAGRLPLPGTSVNGRPPKRATLTAKLIELWNHSFFERRGVELVLYKGRERRSGSQYGAIDLPHDDYDDDTSSSSSSDSGSSDDDQPLNGFYGGYPSDIPDARQRRRAAKAEKRRRRKEKKYRRRQREKRYSLWLSCLPQGGPGGAGAAGFMSTAGSVASGAFPPHSPAMPGSGFRGPSPGPGYTNPPHNMSSYPGMMQ
ncbi:hypothetical protein DFH05DRAFT_1200113 [Lentinula detonsa]|uniref:Uncharacterized protein n=1 Tax=Lentinula detonsa TaxID=2804962 RepID=A0A9W8NYF5_9AGAR|nr:hypothetical protein DFH05DRAFT_1200113 [Lentinula detonsa]KAJ3990294.1 hypothetical protein F5890DRAFT_1480927 [Lentinula detonsa]